jgi:hypothetical protein
MAAIEYSDMLKKAQGKIDMWELLERKRSGIQASTKKI